MSQPILVIGSTGKTGRRIVQQLTDRGHAVRGVSRRTEPRFDWQDRSTWPDALDGVGSAYISFVPDLAADGAPALIEDLVAAATGAGVRRLVLLSGRGESNAERCEQLVRAGSRESTVLRASWFGQNFTEGHLLPSVLDGVIALPAGDVAEPFVDLDDLADVAVAALTGDGHADRLYELTGPRLLTFDQAAAEISRAAGHEVSYLPVTSEQFHAGLLPEVGPDYADLLTELCREVFDGRNAVLADGVQQALGREPRDFAELCAAAAASGVWAR